MTMRWLPVMVLALCAFGSAESQASVYCYGGNSVPAPTLADCPNRIFGASITPTTDGGLLTFTADGPLSVEVFVESGLGQACPGCLYPTSTNSELERAINLARMDDETIITGDGATYSTEKAVVAGADSISISSLAAGAGYTVHVLPVMANRTYGHPWSIDLTTTSIDSPGTAFVATYYADSVNGDNLNDGRTPAQAVRTLGVVQALAGPGDKIGLLDDSDWTEAVRADWGGISETNMGGVFGVYIDEGDSNAVKLYAEGTGVGRGAMPTIGNQIDATCRAAQNCDYSNQSLSGANMGLVQVQSDYMTFSGLRIAETVGVGLMIVGQNYVVVEDNIFEFIGAGQSLRAQQGATNLVFRRNTVSRDTQCYIQGRRTLGLGQGSSQLLDYCGYSQWGASVVGIGVDGILVTENLVQDVFSECININQGSRNAIVFGNVVGSCHSSALYADRLINGIYASNWVYGSRAPVTDWPGGHFGGALESHVETAIQTSNVRVWFVNNLQVSSSSHCFAANVFPSVSGKSTVLNAVGNTCVDPQTQDVVFNRNVVDVTIRNNILLSANPAGSKCTKSNGPPAPVSGDFGYNIWEDVAPAEITCRGTGDQYIAETAVLLPSTQTDWRAANALNPLTLADLRPQAGSPVIGAGDPSLSNLSTGISVSNFSDFLLDRVQLPYALDTAQKRTDFIEYALRFDFTGATRPSTPSIGALEQ